MLMRENALVGMPQTGRNEHLQLIGDVEWAAHTFDFCKAIKNFTFQSVGVKRLGIHFAKVFTAFVNSCAMQHISTQAVRGASDLCTEAGSSPYVSPP